MTHVTRSAFRRSPITFHSVLAVSASILLLWSPGSSSAQEEGHDPAQLINYQLLNDMMNGSDDYFGENTDLGYVDGTKPTRAEPEVTTTQTSTSADTDDSDSSDRSRRRDRDDDGDDGGVSPPPDEPPDEPPPEEPPPPV